VLLRSEGSVTGNNEGALSNYISTDRLKASHLFTGDETFSKPAEHRRRPEIMSIPNRPIKLGNSGFVRKSIDIHKN
jgi:hypothetical protein